MNALKELASLVLEFNDADRDVAENGWDGGKRDCRWESAKAKMVCAARHVLGKEEHEEICEGGSRS